MCPVTMLVFSAAQVSVHMKDVEKSPRKLSLYECVDTNILCVTSFVLDLI